MKYILLKSIFLTVLLVGASASINASQESPINRLSIELLDFTLSQEGVFPDCVPTMECVCKTWKNIVHVKPVYKKMLQKIQEQGGDKHKALLSAAGEEGSFEVMKLLIARGADITYYDLCLGMPLHIAAKIGKIKRVQFLIAKGAPLDVVDSAGNAPLALAKRYGHEEVAQELQVAASRHQLHITFNKLHAYYS